MYNTHTNTSTYTVVDIKKTFENCEADIRMIARRTNKWSMDYVDNIMHDVIKLAESKYLKSVDIALQDTTGNVIKATKFLVNESGTATSSERAGRNDWDNIPSTNLTVILAYTTKWMLLSSEEKSKFKNDHVFKVSWSNSSIDNTFPHLSSSRSQLYASKGYELKKTTFS